MQLICLYTFFLYADLYRNLDFISVRNTKVAFTGILSVSDISELESRAIKIIVHQFNIPVENVDVKVLTQICSIRDG